ncbi:filamentous hemagglutinin N-terminal domain-containing protein [Erwinia sorbitola]|uniref:Filamentous hemagglutinin N-terminal domain-containing protein n=1 Tax=Erwinia sorbitola TaxID=2681984 RepID=A0A6I6ENS2_9GAMM|nr:filamentous hemagglutinin N-terminal domain-containing protein [Erwinia sorbitola]QGU86252.1 filamentous hemagglutinin N-terminal domain-containing protein [Erwinia sorbitola]
MNKYSSALRSGSQKMKSKKSNFRVSSICLMTWMAFSYITPVQATVTAGLDQAQKPGITFNPNGSTTVNINSASPNGISHNKFVQFDVSKHGLVLNNGAESSKTNIAGMVAGNSNMANGSAGLIINEVTSNHASQLNGMIEVAGKKANVIIANPNGINCDGCGFINTGRSTLTTGNILLDNDNLGGIDVTTGNITISGRGMNDNASDYTSLLAKTVKVNGYLQAKDLQIMTGVNKNVTIKNNQLTNTAPGLVKYEKSTGLDVSRLGGMFANKITLIANQKGFGVSNSGGFISAATNLNIDTNGDISNTGTIIGAEFDITATNFTNKGLLNSRSTIGINGGNINNIEGGKIKSSGNMTIAANYIFNQYSSTIQSDSKLNIDAVTLYNRAALVSGKDVNINSNKLVNYSSDSYAGGEAIGGIKATNDINIAGDDLYIGRNGHIKSDSGNVFVSATSKIHGEQSHISAKDITLETKIFNLSAADLKAKNDIVIQSNYIDDNTATTINAAKNLTIFSMSGLTNYGTYQAGNDISLTSFGDVNNYGSIGADNNTNIDAINITNYRNIHSGKDLTINTYGNITNNSAIVSSGNINLYAPESFTNNSIVMSTGSTDIHSKKTTNHGIIRQK